jgi:DNA-binding NtrC family response regulator
MSEEAALLLIVDDEPRILSALRRSLRREPFEVGAVESSREALHHLETLPVDIILSDHKMPGMTGVQLLAAASQLRPNAPRILITGWTEEIPPEDMEAIGVFAVLNKPWDDAELKETLRAAAKARHAEQQAAQDTAKLTPWRSI